MEIVIGRSRKVSLNGFSIQKDNGVPLLFCGGEQIIPLDEKSHAMKICESICVCKGIINKERSKK